MGGRAFFRRHCQRRTAPDTPLYQTHSAHEVLAAFSDKPGLSGYDAVRNRLKAANPSGDFEKFWRKTLNDGVVANAAYPPLSVTAKFNAAGLPPIPAPVAGELEFLFRPDPTIHDGRFANNGWLQELPKPLTKLTWDNTAQLSPATAERLGLSTGQVVELRFQGRTVRAP